MLPLSPCCLSYYGSIFLNEREIRAYVAVVDALLKNDVPHDLSHRCVETFLQDAMFAALDT